MTAADSQGAADRVKPNPEMIAAFTQMVFGYCDHLVPVRALAEKGGGDQMPHTPFMECDAALADKLVIQAGWATDNGMALFVVPGTVAASGDPGRTHRADPGRAGRSRPRRHCRQAGTPGPSSG
ncbi:MAG: hypothetical protein IPK75_12950 [Acidobacteria bacterium]|nr:hypothetical protein [Acidobacteriota bacterium]